MAGEMSQLTIEQKRLVEKNLGLAQKISHDYVEHSSTYELEDIVSAAYQGLIRAAQTFDPHASFIRSGDVENGKAFAGYARLKINGAILDWQKANDYVQRSHRRIYKQIQSLGFGKDRSRKDLQWFSDQLGIPTEKITQAIQAVDNPALSIHSEFDFSEDDEEHTYANMRPSEDDVEKSYFAQSVQDSVAEAISAMPVLHQTIIAMRYYGHYELQQIALELGVSLSVIRDTHSEAILITHQAMVSHLQEEN